MLENQTTLSVRGEGGLHGRSPRGRFMRLHCSCSVMGVCLLTSSCHSRPPTVNELSRGVFRQDIQDVRILWNTYDLFRLDFEVCLTPPSWLLRDSLLRVHQLSNCRAHKVTHTLVNRAPHHHWIYMRCVSSTGSSTSSQTTSSPMYLASWRPYFL